jgi:hypothetical protein
LIGDEKNKDKDKGSVEDETTERGMMKLLEKVVSIRLDSTTLANEREHLKPMSGFNHLCFMISVARLRVLLHHLRAPYSGRNGKGHPQNRAYQGNALRWILGFHG